MTVQVTLANWEHQLLAWAYTALNAHRSAEHEARHREDSPILRAAYRYCSDLTRLHSRTFYIASGLLPAPKRQAVRALYAFCRITDDLVDRCDDANARQDLDEWRQVVSHGQPTSREPVAIAWADARANYKVPVGYAQQLIDGVARDLTQCRYNTFNELAAYAYGVASTVGLMSMHIVGFEEERAIPYAVKLGVALQLTNILRDVGEDWQAGRVYLPQEELRAHGLSDDDIAAGVQTGQISDRWRAFMQFQIVRTRQLYAEAWPGIAMLAPEGRMAIGAAADLYRAILKDIEDHDYDVFTRRARLSTGKKLIRLGRVWWSVRRMVMPESY